MPITPQGALNTTALIVPDIYVQIVPPQLTLLNGVPTNILGIVGTACWGPVNAPVTIGNMSDYAQQFGSLQPRKYDMGTMAATAILQGANNFRCVRVTDGTDTAATATLQKNALTLTSKYTGSLGNTTRVVLSAGSRQNTWCLTVAMPGLVPEVFDNIAPNLTGAAVWQAIATAINHGIDGVRGASQFITATAADNADAPKAGAAVLAGGTDGADNLSSKHLLGQDGLSRTGLYALRNTDTSIALLADCDDPTTWSTQIAFGLSEGIYMIAAGKLGENITDAINNKNTAGIDNYAMKLLLGDGCYFNDTVNGQVRLVSPQGFVAGRLANLSPEQSSLNKPLFGITATQKTKQHLNYSSAELQQLAQAGIDVITNPIPAGKLFGVRFGFNTSSNAVTHGDNYTRMTNYIASTLNRGMGLFIGELQSSTTRHDAAATISHFLANMEEQGMIGTTNGSAAFSVQIDDKNNPPDRVALGYMQADVRITYLSVVEKFLINVEGGQSVEISRQATTLQ